MPSNLLTDPRSQPLQLGQPIPDDPHAVSVCLPTWNDIVGYEENDARVIGRLQAAYPRFGFHPAIQKLCQEVSTLDDNGCRSLPFASERAAVRAQEFVRRRCGFDAVLTSIPGFAESNSAVSVPKNHFGVLQEYWQHAGEILSSRAAQQILSKQPVTYSNAESRQVIRNRVAEIQKTDAANVTLYSSGMAAIAAGFRAVQKVKPGPTCQFGFPYVDTLKVQQKFSSEECIFLPLGNEDDLQALQHRCIDGNISAVFCEIPTNPLLVTPDLHRLKALAQQHGFLLIIDDTLCACGNIDTLPFGDVTVTSLTKYFSGSGNVLAGAVTVNPDSSFVQPLTDAINLEFEETLCDADVAVLEANSCDFKNRMEVTNSNALRLAEFLDSHHAVESVYYPGCQNSVYESLKNDGGGYGGLMSIVLRDPSHKTIPFYDALNVCKGPNLGTRFTLCCPFTLLAHYNELDFAESCGVSRWLLRVSVGIEDCDELIARFGDALDGKL